ncbi:MAG: hypothetical protein ACR2H3_01645 [Acidimicrobiales bacterium]
MYDFAIIMLLGLALFKVVDLVEDFVPQLTRFHLLTTLALAVAGAVAIDYSVFAQYGIELRSADMGTWLTGLIVAGTTTAWRAAFHWFGVSEGEEPEARHQLRSAA